MRNIKFLTLIVAIGLFLGLSTSLFADNFGPDSLGAFSCGEVGSPNGFGDNSTGSSNGTITTSNCSELGLVGDIDGCVTQ